MLKIGIHLAQDRRICVLPSEENCPGYAFRVFSHDQAHARILNSNGGDDFACSVVAIVVDDEYLVADSQWIEYRARMFQHTSDVPSLAKGRND